MRMRSSRPRLGARALGVVASLALLAAAACGSTTGAADRHDPAGGGSGTAVGDPGDGGGRGGDADPGAGNQGAVCAYGRRHVADAPVEPPAVCGAGLQCCYPCGIDGCDSVCATPEQCESWSTLP